MAKKRPSKIEQIDKNFKAKSAASGLRWKDAFDACFAIRGLGWSEENRKARNFRRIPDRAASSLSEAVQFLTWCPASAFLSFCTNASEIAVRVANEDAAMMKHMAPTGTAGLELYTRKNAQWLPMATAMANFESAEYEQELIKGLSAEMREYRLYFPLYKRLNRLGLGFSPGSVVKSVPASKGTRPIFFYGTSITQGGCANTAGSDFVSILGRTLDTEVINFGFSGSGKGEPAVARLISEIDAEIFVLDYAANTTPDQLRDTLPEFVRILRKKHPRTPIVLIGNIAFNQVLWDSEIRNKVDRRRTEMMDFYIQKKRAGDERIYYIDGDGLIAPGLTGTYVDGVHPTTHGFVVMAERLTPLLNAVRIWNQPEAIQTRPRKKAL